MSTSFFEAYGTLAESVLAPTVQAGRHATQARAERLIAADVAGKLALTPDSHLLEIGCGPGNLMIPLSFQIASATGVDHHKVVEIARKRFSAPNVDWIAGEFPDVAIDRAFDAILVYSVLHYMRDMDGLLRFCESAARLLRPGGRLLLGDMPNADRKKRFLASEAGIAFDAQWRAGQLAASAGAPQSDPFDVFKGREALGAFTDADMLSILAHFRGEGLHAHLLAQPEDLPFGRTREDILIVRP